MVHRPGGGSAPGRGQPIALGRAWSLHRFAAASLGESSGLSYHHHRSWAVRDPAGDSDTTPTGGLRWTRARCAGDPYDCRPVTPRRARSPRAVGPACRVGRAAGRSPPSGHRMALGQQASISASDAFSTRPRCARSKSSPNRAADVSTVCGRWTNETDQSLGKPSLWAWRKRPRAASSASVAFWST